jgi:hypothetical protein
VKISQLTGGPTGWTRFNLNIGGFSIRNCRWRASTRQVLFPKRYDTHRRPHAVVYAHGIQVIRLRKLLESGQTATPRDRRPCVLRIHGLHSIDWEPGWYVFNFTVRGFTILGCRWKPETGSIQLPITFFWDSRRLHDVKKRVVWSFGAHINRLRRALEAYAPDLVRSAEAPQPVEHLADASCPGTEAAVIEGASSTAAPQAIPPSSDTGVGASAADSPVLVETNS